MLTLLQLCGSDELAIYLPITVVCSLLCYINPASVQAISTCARFLLLYALQFGLSTVESMWFYVSHLNLHFYTSLKQGCI